MSTPLSASIDVVDREKTVDREQVLELSFPASELYYERLQDIPADFVGVVTPIELSEEFRPDSTPQNQVWSTWIVRVDKAAVGPFSPGDTFKIGVRGGHLNPDAVYSIETGVLRGTARPGPGDKSVLVVYEEYPRFEVGRPELIFASPSADKGASHWFVSSSFGRYLVRQDGSLDTPRPFPIAYPLIAETRVLKVDEALRRGIR